MDSENDKDLLAGAALSPEQLTAPLEAFRLPDVFFDRQAALRCVQRLARLPQLSPFLAHFLPSLLARLATNADPDRVLVNFERFVESSAKAPEMNQILAENPRAVEILGTLFAGSQFLTEILLRNPRQLETMIDPKRLSQVKDVETIRREAEGASSHFGSVDERLDALRIYQRQELLRIGTCDLLGLYDLSTVTRQLSNLADALVQACLVIAAGFAGQSCENFAVIALGKLGGQELNYSSDIDLMFLTRANVRDHLKLGERLIETLARMTSEGFLYRVDMRLRPWGKDGSLVSTLEGFSAYLARHARLWEKQALLKARFVAGDWQVGRDFLEVAFPRPLDAAPQAISQDVHAMKQRTEAYLHQKGRSWGEIKLGEGSIRDIEFVVQFLQLSYGARDPAILAANTLLGLDRLGQHHYLLPEEQRVLKDGYIFFRTVEHHLQMMHYQQTYTLPSDPKGLAQLAQRLGFQDPQARELFIDRYEQHRSAVRGIYLRYVGNQPMESPKIEPPLASPANLSSHLNRMDPSYQAAFTRAEIQRHAALASKLSGDHLVEVDVKPIEAGSWQVTIVAFDYPGELTLICGLLFVYRLNIESGLVFTYEPLESAKAAPGYRDERRIIVDVFKVRYINHEIPPNLWEEYAHELEQFLRLMQAGERVEARSLMAKRFAGKYGEPASMVLPLYPIEVVIDNDLSEKYTVLQIFAQDTAGFLYELTNALAFHRIYISQVKVESRGNRVYDTLYVTGEDGKKITDPGRQRELRAAIVLIKHFTHLLPHSANPEAAILHFSAFIEKLFQQPDWPDDVTSLERPEVLRALAQVLGVSDFLWEDFLRMQYENLFPVIRDITDLTIKKDKHTLSQELEACLSEPGERCQDPIQGTGWRAALNTFKDRELFRVDMRHILGYTTTFEDFSQELTDLAEVLVQTGARLCDQELAQIYGAPLQENGQVCPLSICALGKCGGTELGFASDIELMFIYSGKGQTSGPKVITSAEYFEKLVQAFLGAVRARREGIFHIDLQLRPYGKAGSMAVSLAAFENYFHPQGPAWGYERQALVKLRPIAGDAELGKQIQALRDAYVYTGEPFDAKAMRAMRERQIRHLVTGGTFNAKYSPGGLLDVEYLVQGLQITHGHKHPDLRETNTRAALAALAKHAILSQEEYDRLRKAHTFLRWLIDSLRVVRGNAKDLTVPPFGSVEFEYLTRRLQYGKDIERLRDELQRFTQDVLELNQKLLG